MLIAKTANEFLKLVGVNNNTVRQAIKDYKLEFSFDKSLNNGKCLISLYQGQNWELVSQVTVTEAKFFRA